MYRTMVGIKSCALTEYTAFDTWLLRDCSAVELEHVIEKSICSYIKVDLDRRKLQEDIEAESLQVSNGFVAADNDVSVRLKYEESGRSVNCKAAKLTFKYLLINQSPVHLKTAITWVGSMVLEVLPQLQHSTSYISLIFFFDQV